MKTSDTIWDNVLDKTLLWAGIIATIVVFGWLVSEIL